MVKERHEEGKDTRGDARGAKEGGERATDKRWMEEARTGATELFTDEEQQQRRWRQKAETCPQVTHTNTHTDLQTVFY